ncbi:sugar-binding domain-containing protein [Saccharicrinis sp. FJH2]|uniref:sugar-binding domain-containing protein n=1 Tax=Saccharicrinis sp. FJH65 TaxID=3344659 RepID=UPI0035F2D9CB
MKTFKTTLTLIVTLLTIMTTNAQVSFGTPQKINDNWKFILADPKNASETNFDDSKWRTLDLPHDWSVEGTLNPSLYSCTGYLPGGIGWYRKSLDIPKDKSAEKVYLYFEGVYNRSKVYLNGHLLGERPNGYISFMYDATPYIKYGEPNEVAVRVDHSRQADSRWYTGSGIYRNVWLVYANPVHISEWGVFVYPESSSAKKATLKVETSVTNSSDKAAKLDIVNELYTADGKKVAQSVSKLSVSQNESNKTLTSLNVKNPELWSLDSPNLYTLKTTVKSGNKVLDQTETKTGIRSFTFDPDKGFALNGKWMKVKGVCLHHDGGVLGAAVPKLVWEKRLKELKEIGCNAIRTSHNPQAPDLYALCDELGLLVMDEAFDEWEFPKRKWLEGWNVGTPGFEGSYDFFEEWSSRDLGDMVRRDRNHPSIMMWSIGNEVDYPNDPYSHPVLDGSAISQPMYGGYKPESPDANRLGDIAKRLVKVVKEYDTSRPATAALAGVVMSNQTAYPGALDVAGYNYTENRYAEDHKTYPDRIIYGSENRHDMAAWKAVRDNDYIFGQFLWTGVDYLGEAGRWPSRGFNSGLISLANVIKPRGYFREALWSNKPFAYVGTYPNWRNRDYKSIDAWQIWNYNEGQNIRVVCYTNAAEAKLMLNGEQVGEIKPYDDETGVIAWDIPFKPGKLQVVGLDKDGKEICTDAIQTSERPFALKANTEEKIVDKDKGLSIVTIQVVDENGVPVILSDDEVSCRIHGPAKLLGLEAGNPSDMTSYTDRSQRVFMGKLTAYIQANGEAGEISVDFSAPWLKGATVQIKAE